MEDSRRLSSTPSKLRSSKTAKQHDRHFVQHNYHDRALERAEVGDSLQAISSPVRQRGGVTTPFPIRLHQVLDKVEQQDGLADIISWQPHGRCFVIHQPKQFVQYVMPRYFNQTKLTSFQRQLNLYGFIRLTRGPDTNGYYHEYFLRGRPFLVKYMTRTRVKGTKIKGASSPEQEPDFYAMPPVTTYDAAVAEPFATEESDEDDSAERKENMTKSSESFVHQVVANLPEDKKPSVSSSPDECRAPTFACSPCSNHVKNIPLPELPTESENRSVRKRIQNDSLDSQNLCGDLDEATTAPSFVWVSTTQGTNPNSKPQQGQSIFDNKNMLLDFALPPPPTTLLSVLGQTSSQLQATPPAKVTEVLDPVDAMLLELQQDLDCQDDVLHDPLLGIGYNPLFENNKIQNDHVLGQQLDQILQDTMQW